jgi:site-specific DNA recombinase
MSKLRFAIFIRVSTEKQKKGESLATQAKQIEAAVEALGGTITKRYGGQEHATEGWEQQQLDKLLSDAVKKPKLFDAVMVADPTRLAGRDNEKSKKVLRYFRDHSIDYYLLASPQNLHDPNVILFLGVSAEIGEFQARMQAQKSMLNRIERAKRNIPSGGTLPCGRTFDRSTNTWHVIPEYKAKIEAIAARYLKGEKLKDLGKEYGLSRCNLNLILREMCGDKIVTHFVSKTLNIDEHVTLTVPRLLSDKTIKALKHTFAQNRTRTGHAKYEYLLSGYIYCAGCGYLMTGQRNRAGKLYYRHAFRERVKPCPVGRPFPWVPAKQVERAVVRHLFHMLGNPAAIERAVKAAIPDSEKALKDQDRLQKELASIAQKRERLVNSVAEGLLKGDAIKKKSSELDEREALLTVQLSNLADIPDAKTLRQYVTELEVSGRKVIMIEDDEGNTYAGGNDLGSLIVMEKSRQDLQHLIQSSFGCPMPDGKPAGVYVTAHGKPHMPKSFELDIRGLLTGSRVVKLACGRAPHW